jgi:hypothetical protein
MKLFLIGGTGFDGSYFPREALRRGYTVPALRRTPNSRPRISLEQVPEWVEGELGSVSPVIRANIFRAATPARYANTRLISRKENQITVSKTSGITAGEGVLISLELGNLRYFPERETSGGAITVASEWGLNPIDPDSESLVFARKLGNFIQMVAACSYGIKRKFFVANNSIDGFPQDITSSNIVRVAATNNISIP